MYGFACFKKIIKNMSHPAIVIFDYDYIILNNYH